MTIQEFVMNHTIRGECKCGQCVDVGTKPDPTGHTVDMVFFKVAPVGEPSAEEFEAITKNTRGEFTSCDPLDGKHHNYIELGGWIGDQGLAMMYMGLGTALGVFELLSPVTMLHIASDDPLAKQIAGSGLLSVTRSAHRPK